MIDNLQNSFDKLINDEAIRIMGRMLIMYEKKIKVNKAFDKVISDLAKENYKYFWIDLMIRICEHLPKSLCKDFTGEYVLVNKDDYRDQTLINHEINCKKLQNKNHKQASKQMAKIVVEYCVSNPTCSEDLLQIMVINMNRVMPSHNDSVDCNTILMYLKQDILNYGYLITRLFPLRIKKIDC